MSSLPAREIERAAAAIRGADALLIGAGAGMGVDSGLPDFRGNEGFWRAYPPFRGRAFAEVSNPVWFDDDPETAWGFFGHRLSLYRSTAPHAGFAILRSWMSRARLGGFVFTSNVDGQFQRAGFDEDQIVECHGSLHWLQCTVPCAERIWTAESLHVDVDMSRVRAVSTLPGCGQCEEVARPNVLMFDDGSWLPIRQEEQWRRYRDWRRRVAGARVVAIEIGAETAIPTVRYECARAAATVVRINPREWQTAVGSISLPGGALETLTAIEALLTPSRNPE